MNPSTTKLLMILISFFFLSFTLNLNLVAAGCDGCVAVVSLNRDDFQCKVINSCDLWMVHMSAPYCGFARRLVPEWEKAAKNLEGKVKFGYVNCDNNQEFIHKYSIASYPWMLAFGKDKQNPKRYTGARTAPEIEAFALAELEAMKQ